jgi:hypothetical protein
MARNLFDIQLAGGEILVTSFSFRNLATVPSSPNYFFSQLRQL